MIQALVTQLGADANIPPHACERIYQEAYAHTSSGSTYVFPQVSKSMVFRYGSPVLGLSRMASVAIGLFTQLAAQFNLDHAFFDLQGPSSEAIGARLALQTLALATTVESYDFAIENMEETGAHKYIELPGVELPEGRAEAIAEGSDLVLKWASNDGGRHIADGWKYVIDALHALANGTDSPGRGEEE
jgi:hypothetical protein